MVNCTAPTDSTQTTSSTAPTYKDDKGKVLLTNLSDENSAKQYDDRNFPQCQCFSFQIAQSVMAKMMKKMLLQPQLKSSRQW